jgi:hypothetical protein
MLRSSSFRNFLGPFLRVLALRANFMGSARRLDRPVMPLVALTFRRRQPMFQLKCKGNDVWQFDFVLWGGSGGRGRCDKFSCTTIPILSLSIVVNPLQ